LERGPQEQWVSARLWEIALSLDIPHAECAELASAGLASLSHLIRTGFPACDAAESALGWRFDGSAGMWRDGTSSSERMSQIPDHAPQYVSVVNEFPEDLYAAMRSFVSEHPQWDQYRLMHAALAGFLFQHGCNNRAVSQHYLDGLFRRAPQPMAETA